MPVDVDESSSNDVSWIERLWYRSMGRSPATSIDHQSESVTANKQTILDNEEGAMVPPPITTGWQRVHRLFYRDDRDERPESIQLLMSCIKYSFLSGLMVGGLQSIRDSWERFDQYAKTSRFITVGDMHSRRMNFIVLMFGKNGVRFGLRLSCLIGFTGFGALSMATYRNRPLCCDVPISSGITGGLLFFRYGLRASFVGAIISSVLGAMVTAILITVGYSISPTEQQINSFGDAYRYSLIAIMNEYHKNLVHSRKLNAYASEHKIIWRWTAEKLMQIEEEEKTKSKDAETGDDELSGDDAGRKLQKRFLDSIK